MKKFLKFGLCFLFFLGFLGSVGYAQSDIVECPATGKACSLRGMSFKTLRDKTILQCKHGSDLITILTEKSQSPETIDPTIRAFNRSVGKIVLASEKCNKNKYEEAISEFEAIILQTKTELISEINRLSSEGKTEDAEALKAAVEGTSNIYHDILKEVELNSNLAAIPDSQSIFSSGDGKILGYETKLKDYTQGQKTGSGQFRSTVEATINFIKKAMVPIAIFLIVFSGIELISMRGSGAEETATKKKNMIISIIGGFFIFFLAVNAVDWVLFGTEGQILREDSIDGSVEFAKRGFAEFEGIYSYLSTFVTIIGVLFIIITSFQLVFSGGDEDSQEKAKKRILYTVIGVAVIITLRPLLNIFTQGGRFSTPSATPVIELLSKWADFIMGFLGVLGVIALIYGGIQMVLHFGNDEAQEKAKKTIQYALLGLAIAFSAWTIINFFANPSGTGTQTSFEGTQEYRTPSGEIQEK